MGPWAFLAMPCLLPPCRQAYPWAAGWDVALALGLVCSCWVVVEAPRGPEQGALTPRAAWCSPCLCARLSAPVHTCVSAGASGSMHACGHIRVSIVCAG